MVVVANSNRLPFTFQDLALFMQARRQGARRVGFVYMCITGEPEVAPEWVDPAEPLVTGGGRVFDFVFRRGQPRWPGPSRWFPLGFRSFPEDFPPSKHHLEDDDGAPSRSVGDDGGTSLPPSSLIAQAGLLPARQRPHLCNFLGNRKVFPWHCDSST